MQGLKADGVPDKAPTLAISYEPTFQYASLDTGINMAYVLLGSSEDPPVVLLHGATDSYLSFSQVAPRLANAGYYVIVPELRGHGHTDKPLSGPYTVSMHAADINALLAQLDLSGVHIVGHSMGSFTAQYIAAAYPDRAASLTLIGTSGRIAGNETMAWILEGDGEFLGVNHVTELPDDFLRAWIASSNYDDIFVQKLYESVAQLSVPIWDNIFNGIDIGELADPAAITIPVQIIWGTEDNFFSKDDQLDLIARLGSSRIEFLTKAGIGHNTHWEGRLDEEITADILHFLSTLQALYTQPLLTPKR